tara:strand:+ start:17193 stop:18971 length:1779 start_codon:yes stop_codon:yes gene_type:complete
MNIIEQEDIIKGLPDDALQREARMPSGQVPQFLVVSEIQRRTDMRKRFEANQPQQNMSVAEQVVQEGIGAVQPTMMASSGGRTPFTAKYANGGISGSGLPQIGSNFVRNLTLDPYGNPVNIDPSTEAEFILRNRGYDVGPLGIPIYESTRDNERSANIRDLISRDQTTRFDLPLDAYATGRAETPIDRGIDTLQNIDIDLSNPLSRAMTDANKNAPTSFDESVLGRGTSRALDFLGNLSLPETDYSKFPYTRARQEGDLLFSNIVGAGSLQGLFDGSDVLNPPDEITFAATSDTPRGDDTPTALTSAQILSNARENIENARNPQNVSSAELLAQIQPNQTDKTATDFEAPTVVDDPVTNAEKLLDEINPNIDTTVITGPTVADAAKTDPVSIAAKQYADLLGGEKNDKMRNALMLASLGAGIAKGDTAGGLQQAANVAASYQQKEIDRAEKGLDRAIKRADTEAMQDLKRQEVEGRIGYYDVLKLNAQNEQTRLAQAADLKAEERDASYRQTATRILNQGLEQALKNVPKYKTMTAAQQAAVRRNILNQTADITLRYEGSAYAPFLDQLINSMASATGGKSRSSSYTVIEKR